MREAVVDGAVEGVDAALKTEERCDVAEAGVSVGFEYENLRMSGRAGVAEVCDRDAIEEGGGIESSKDDKGVSLSLENENKNWSLSALVTVP